jgi:hypothetical protein
VRGDTLHLGKVFRLVGVAKVEGLLEDLFEGRDPNGVDAST